MNQTAAAPFIKMERLFPPEKKKKEFNLIVQNVLLGLSFIGNENDEKTKDAILGQISEDKLKALGMLKESSSEEIKGATEICSMFWKGEDGYFFLEFIYGTERYDKLMDSIFNETKKSLKAQNIKYENEVEFEDVCRRNVATAKNAIQTAITQKFLLSGLMGELVNSTSEVGELSGIEIKTDELIQDVMKLVEKYIPAEARIAAANKKMEIIYRKFL